MGLGGGGVFLLIFVWWGFWVNCSGGFVVDNGVGGVFGSLDSFVMYNDWL